MSREETTSTDKQYFQTYSGAFRTRVSEDNPEAISRILQKGPNEGRVVYEREVKALFGTIENVAVETHSEYGKRLVITLDKNDEGKHPVLSFGVESKDGRDVLKKLPAIDFSKEVRIMPYRFTPEDRNDEISGISIFHADDEGKFTVKVENYFFDPVKKEHTHGYPTIDWDNSSESEQKIYKIQRDEFLVKYAEENVISKFQSGEVSTQKPAEVVDSLYNRGDMKYPEEEVDPADIPF
jgi:hypothetical protein